MIMDFLLPQSPQAISDLCRIPHPEQHQSGKTNPRHWILTGILIFPRGKRGLGCGSAPKHPPKVSQQRGDIGIHHLDPQPLGMTFQQLGAGSIYILLQKKKGEVHTWGENGVNNNYLKPGFQHCAPQVQGAAGSPGSQPGLTAWLGSRNPGKQWDHTQGECVGHSFWFNWQNTPAGGRRSS